MLTKSCMFMVVYHGARALGNRDCLEKGRHDNR